MVIKMTRYEKLAGDHCRMFAKNWDYFCIASGAYLSGYREAKEDCQKLTEVNFDNVGREPVEVTYKDGDHQLSLETFERYKKEIIKMPFKEALTKLLNHYDFKDVRVDTNEDGVVSFQGTATVSEKSSALFIEA